MVNYLVLVLLLSVTFCTGQLGGWMVRSTTDESVKKVAEKAVNKLGENGVDLQLIKICDAQSQLVAGLNYRITMIAKNKDSSDDSTNQLCTFQAWEKVWEKFLEFKNISCDKKQTTCPNL